MSEERKKILEMLSEGKINIEEAERLLSAISDNPEGASQQASREESKKEPKYLRIMVEPGEGSVGHDRVNIRVPMKLIRAGLKLTSFIPKEAQGKINEALVEKGIDADFSRIKPEDLEDIIRQIDDLSVDVEGKEKVKIFCE